MKTISLLFLSIILFFSSQVYGQDSSTKGTDFWFAFMDNGEPTGTTLKKLSVFISSDEINSGTVTVPGFGFTQNFVVGANSTVEVIVPLNVEFEDRQIIGNNGVHVTTDKPATVYALNYMSFSSDATIVYPTNTLGREYFNLGYTTWSSSYPSLMMLVGAHDNTALEITPSEQTSLGNPPGVPFTITLNQGETYLIANTQSGGDLSGTYVKSIPNSDGECKEVALFGGHYCANVPVGSVYCDHLFEQIPPTKQWGKSFIGVPLKTRKKDIYRVLASIDNTTVDIGATSVNLDRGEFYDITVTTPVAIEADNPILVTQFSGGTSFDNVANSDPFMVIVSPIEQTIEQVTFTAFSSTLILAFHLNVIVKTADVAQTFLDGVNVASEFSVVTDNPDYSYAQIDVSVGVHNLVNVNGLVSYIYGFGIRESYGYVAGANLKAINKSFDVVQGGLDTTFFSDFNNIIVCPGETLDFIAISNDPEIDGYSWDFGGGLIIDGDMATQTYPDTGTYTVTLIIRYINGCEEEKLETTFEVRELEVIEQISVCQGDTVFGIPVLADMILCDTFLSFYGCDSVHCYDIIMEFLAGTQVDTTICQNDSIFGVLITSDTLICNTYTSFINGCDSSHCYNVFVDSAAYVQVDTIICENEMINGIPINSDTLICSVYGTVGCDSTFCLNVIVESPVIIQQDTTICKNTLFNGIPITSDTLICANYLTVNGCDSTHCFNVMTNSLITTQSDTIVCRNSPIYGIPVLNDTTICQTFLATSNGCDSMHCYTITLRPPISTQSDTMVCANSVIYGTFVASDTTLCQTSLASNGCDSTHCFVITLRPPISTQSDTMVCANSVIYGTFVVSDTTLCQTSLASNGCDSTHCFVITLRPPISTQSDTMVCPNSVIYGNVVTSATTLCQTFLASNDCDSTHCYNVTLIPPISTQKDTIVCQNSVVYGTFILSDTTVCQNFVTLNGCDSTHCYVVTAELPVFTQQDTTICEGSVFDGQFVFSDTMVCNTYPNVNDCDSTHCFNIKLKYPVEVDQDTSVCEGEIIYGVAIVADAYLCSGFIAANGCDSTHCFTVSVNFPVSTQMDTMVCAGANINGLTVYEDTLLCNTFIGSNGCDSTHCINVEITEPDYNTINSTICDGEVYPFGGSFYTVTGQYTEDFVPLGDCQPINTLNLKVLPSLEDSLSLTICEGEEYLGHKVSGVYIDTIISNESCVVNTLTLEVEEEFQMEIIDDYRCPCSNQASAYNFEKSGLYIIDTLTNSNGCEVIQAVNYTNYSVYIPNAFSPNGDGVNDEFRVYKEIGVLADKDEITIEYLGIFDRWGGTIIERRQELVMNKPLWDGTVSGKELNNGVYVYAIKLRCPATGRSFMCKGDITLVK